MTATTILLFATACVSLTVLWQSFHQAAGAWRELRQAAATCPEVRACRITHFEFVVRPVAEPVQLRPVRRPALLRPMPALREAA